MEFVLKKNKINIVDPSINLTDGELKNKLFYFSDINTDTDEITLYLDKLQITENLNFDCLFPSNSKIKNIIISNQSYPFYENNEHQKEELISYTKQSINIIVDNNNKNILIITKRFKLTNE